jgi:hypothetical protein
MKKINKHIRKNATYFLLVGLLLHVLVIHGMIKSSVIYFEDDGTTSIENSFDGTSSAGYNDILSARHESITNNSKDLLLAEQFDHRDQILIKNPNNVIVKIQIFAEVPFNTAANEVHPIFYTNLTSNSSTSLTQFKTVSLLI